MSAPSNPWLAALHDWPTAAIARLEHERALVRVLVAAVRGSAPREAGVAMLVGATEVIGTIGGGQLEWQALAAARALLSAGEVPARVQRLVLGTDLAQCCGGVVELWIERFAPDDRPLLEAARRAAAGGPALLQSTLQPHGIRRTLLRPDAAPDRMPRLSRASDGTITLLERLDRPLPRLWLYGAGYVGQAVARVVLALPLQLTWIDERSHLFPAGLPSAVTIHSDEPRATVADAPRGTHFLVMTHSHALDYALVRALLERGDFASLGLIGSQSKSARFRSRLRREGVEAERLARLTCPIGIGGITSKWPAAIAIAVAAQLLQRLEAPAGAAGTVAALTPEDCSGQCARCPGGASTVP